MKNTLKVLLIIGSIMFLLFICVVFIGAITFKSIDPSSKFSDARNAERENDITSIANAMKSYIYDNPNNVSMFENIINDCEIGTTDIEPVSSRFDELLVPLYLSMIPTDPKNDKNSTYNMYEICKNDLTYTISAPNAEGEVIEETFQLIIYLQ